MEEIDILDFLRYYLSKLFVVVFMFLFVVILGNIYITAFKVPLYRSDTTVILVSENTEQQYSQTDLSLNKNLVSTYSNIVKSKKVLNKVISELDLNLSYSELYNMVKVSNVNETEIIKISVTSANNEDSATIANAIVPIFSKEVERIYGIENVSTLDEAVAASKAYNINFIKDNIIFALIGIFLGSAIIFIMYYFDTTVKSAEMLEDKLGLTVIGMVPKVERKD